VYGADRFGAGIEPVEQWDDALLVRNGDVAAAPVRVRAAPVEKIGEFVGRNPGAHIIAGEAQPIEPVLVDHRRLRLGDRVADNFGVGHGRHMAQSRNAPTSASSTSLFTNASPMPR